MSRVDDPVQVAVLALRGILQGQDVDPSKAAVLAEALVDALVEGEVPIPTKTQYLRAALDGKIHALLPAAGPQACVVRFGVSKASVYRAVARENRRRKSHVVDG